jgi:hypothetical protein
MPREKKLDYVRKLQVGTNVRILLAQRGRGFENYDEILNRLMDQYEARMYK